MKTYTILRRNAWRDAREAEKAGERSRQIGEQDMPTQVRWIRSYILNEANGSVGTICIYEAVGADALREHARRANIPVDEIIEVGNTVVVHPDPVTA